MKYSPRSPKPFSIRDNAEAPSSLRIVAAIFFAVFLAVAVVVAGLWLYNESFVYRGDGTPYP
ncbi:MAG: hypothetical protein ACR2FY_10155 [Pirellulaceae bacterium]